MCRVSSFHCIPSCNITLRRSGMSGRLRRSFAGWCACSRCCSPRRRPPTCRRSSRDVTTPLGTARARVLQDVVGIVPILRAGLGMADGVIELLPEAEVWHIGLYRDESTLRPKEYYNKFPVSPRVTLALLVDPMLATGGSAVRACEIIKAAGVPANEAALPDRRTGGDREFAGERCRMCRFTSARSTKG